MIMLEVVYALILSSIPAIYFSGFSNGFDLAKNTIFRSLILIIILIYGALFVYKKELKIRVSRFKDPLALLFFAIVGLFSVETFFSETPLVSFFGNYQRQFGLISLLFLAVFFFSLLNELKIKSIHKLALLMFFACGGISIYALLQRLGFNPLFGDFNDKIFEGRVYSTLGNPDFLAQYIAPILPLGIAFFIESKRKIFKLLVGVIFLFSLAALFFTQSRASVLGLGVGLAFGIVYFVWKNPKLYKLVLKLAVPMLVLCAILFTVLLPALGVKRFSFDATNTRSLQSRFAIWGAATKLIADHPLTGTGIDTFSLYFPQYADPKFFQYEEALNITADREHNELLQFGVWGGLPAMALYIALMVLAIKSFFKNKKKLSYFEQSIYIGFIVFIAQNQFTFSSLTHYAILLFFLAAIVIMNQTKEKEFVLKFPVKLSLLFVPFSFLILFVWYQTVLLPLRADAAYIRAIYGSSTQEELVGNLRKAIEFNPYAALFDYEMMMRNPAEFENSLEKMAMKEGETMDVLAWKGNFWSDKDLPKAMIYYEKALQKNATYPPLLRAVGDAYFRNHDCPNALVYYQEFLKFAPPFWQWKSDLTSRSAAEQKTYRIFLTKNEPDFPLTFQHIVDCSKKTGDDKAVQYYSQFLSAY